jgi:hypothetical protein
MDAKLKTMIAALVFSTLVLFIRCVPFHFIACRDCAQKLRYSSIYRILELATGWNGRVMHTEVYFNLFDGGMVILAIFTTNFAHPGRLLGSRREAAKAQQRRRAHATRTHGHTSSQGSSTRTLMAQV